MNTPNPIPLSVKARVRADVMRGIANELQRIQTDNPRFEAELGAVISYIVKARDALELISTMAAEAPAPVTDEERIDE